MGPEASQRRYRRRLLFYGQHRRGLGGQDRDEIPASPHAPKNLEEQVARYNSFVDAGKDEDFGKPTPKYKIIKPPFYAAWATPNVHDARAGLRINAKCQVQDMAGRVIPGLYCGGESAGGFSQHGLARAVCQGYIAGKNAVLEKAM
jgi:succinate dehydrogenase/fumarate reductase flavoprotein subunit